MTPKRIQRKRTKGWRMPAGALYVGRPTKWANPYKGDDAAALFRRDIEAAIVGQLSPAELDFWRQNHPLGAAGPAYILAQAKEQLRGFDLCCWCPPGRSCHADFLLEIANA